MIRQIEIITIPHSNQRYNTCGDWQFQKSTTEDGVEKLIISVSDTGREAWNFLIARHELDEAMLCRANGVTQKEVDDYDAQHTGDANCPACFKIQNPNSVGVSPEYSVAECRCGSDCLSDCPDSPYFYEHNNATVAEYQMSQLLGVDWRQYSAKIEELMRSYEQKRKS